MMVYVRGWLRPVQMDVAESRPVEQTARTCIKNDPAAFQAFSATWVCGLPRVYIYIYTVAILRILDDSVVNLDKVASLLHKTRSPKRS